jgi:hypothetical protein
VSCTTVPVLQANTTGLSINDNQCDETSLEAMLSYEKCSSASGPTWILQAIVRGYAHIDHCLNFLSRVTSRRAQVYYSQRHLLVLPGRVPSRPSASEHDDRSYQTGSRIPTVDSSWYILGWRVSLRHRAAYAKSTRTYRNKS